MDWTFYGVGAIEFPDGDRMPARVLRHPSGWPVVALAMPSEEEFPEVSRALGLDNQVTLASWLEQTEQAVKRALGL